MHPCRSDAPRGEEVDPEAEKEVESEKETLTVVANLLLARVSVNVYLFVGGRIEEPRGVVVVIEKKRKLDMKMMKKDQTEAPTRSRKTRTGIKTRSRKTRKVRRTRSRKTRNWRKTRRKKTRTGRKTRKEA